MRLFVAVWPPPAVVDGLEALTAADAPGVRPVAADARHVTLRFLGTADPDAVTARLDDADLPAATAVFGPAVTLLGREAVVVPVAGLDGLAAAVTVATATVGRPPDRRPFRGHATVARLRRGATCPYVGAPFAASFEVGEVVLARSTLGPAGARYEVMARWAVPVSGRSTA